MEHWDSPLGAGFRLGDWEINPQQSTIIRGEQQCHLEPKVMEVLLYLAVHHGEVVKREQLIDQVWRTVVGDEVLSRAIYLLRSGLGDDPKAPRFIQTVPKAGYRLLIKPQPREATLPASLDAPSKVQPRKRRLVRAVRKARAVIAVLSLLVLCLTWFILRQGEEELVATDQRNWFNELFAREQDNSGITSLAVLPFEDLSVEGDQGYLADSLTDELITALSKIEGLRVVARRSVINLPQDVRDTKTIGRYFGVDAVLEGTIKVQPQGLRISAQLGSTGDGFVLWSETYDDPGADLFAIQKTALKAITRHLQEISATELVPPEETSAEPDLAAYQLFLNGRYLLKLRGSGALNRSIDLFEQALVLDPNFTRARLALAKALVLTPFYDGHEEGAVFSRVLAMLDAVTLKGAQEEAEAASIRGFIANRQWKFVEAELMHTKAVRLNPTDSDALVWYSMHLATVGRIEESRLVAMQAQELDQVSAVVNNRLAISLLWANEDAKAAEYFAKGNQQGFSIEANRSYLIYLYRQQRWREMQRLFELFLKHDKVDTDWANDIFAYFAGRADHGAAMAAIDKAIEHGTYPARMELASWIILGEPERVIATVEKYRNSKKNLEIELFFIKEAEVMRKNPRFARITEMTGLQAYWTRFGSP